ncbi:MAG: hypothetical protein M4579_000370 [Chaenotheca gracillima]|nr:MAG: hypothetical protein M4579_000370 [Chaenotheca gracillima]
MHDDRPSPLLAQIPLTVSPFVSLPRATTLPYSYKSLPSTLPRSATGEVSDSEKPRYVVSSSGHAAHPDEIIASCQALQKHIQTAQEEADRVLREWDDSIKERELAEKRKVAPGWLDSDAKILEPERKKAATASADAVSLMDSTSAEEPVGSAGQGDISSNREGEELDRAFGGINLQSRAEKQQ